MVKLFVWNKSQSMIEIRIMEMCLAVSDYVITSDLIEWCENVLESTSAIDDESKGNVSNTHFCDERRRANALIYSVR